MTKRASINEEGLLSLSVLRRRLEDKRGLRKTVEEFAAKAQDLDMGYRRVQT